MATTVVPLMPKPKSPSSDTKSSTDPDRVPEKLFSSVPVA